MLAFSSCLFYIHNNIYDTLTSVFFTISMLKDNNMHNYMSRNKFGGILSTAKPYDCLTVEIASVCLAIKPLLQLELLIPDKNSQSPQ